MQYISKLKRAHVPSTHLPPVVISYQAIGQWQNQKINVSIELLTQIKILFNIYQDLCTFVHVYSFIYLLFYCMCRFA